MFGGIHRLLARRRAPYARRVAAELAHAGFNPNVLDEFRALGALNPEGSIFRILADRRLKPADAALAIRLASHRYLEACASIEALGDRGAAKRRPKGGPEAHFLKLLEEATEALRFTH